MGKVRIRKIGGAGDHLNLHGIVGAIKFDDNGEAVVEESDWEHWVAPYAEGNRIARVDPDLLEPDVAVEIPHPPTDPKPPRKPRNPAKK